MLEPEPQARSEVEAQVTRFPEANHAPSRLSRWQRLWRVWRAVAMAWLMLEAGAAGAHSQLDDASAGIIMPGCEAFLAERYDEPTPQMFLQGVCAGQVAGVWDAAATLHTVCAPDDNILNQGMRIVVQFINARPARMRERFTDLALEGLMRAWPCK